MNTTSSTSDSGEMPYTVVGGKGGDRGLKKEKLISCAVLHRGGRYQRADLFSNLAEAGVDEVLSIEHNKAQYDVEELSERFPQARFLLMHRDMTTGEQINVAMGEARSRYVFVVWNDMQVSPIPPRVRKQLESEDQLCWVPFFRNERGEPVPNVIAPAFYRGLLRIIPFSAGNEQARTLFPFDYTGLYNRERFVQLHGYDGTITNPYWQKLDFGFRAYMWGESIYCLPSLRVQHLSHLEPDDTTPDESYRRFYLKNLAISYQGDHARLPLRKLPAYFARTRGGLIHSYKLFREIRRWVNQNKFRFRQNARSVTDLWEFERT